MSAQLASDVRGVGGLRASLATAAAELRAGQPKAQDRAAELIASTAATRTAPVVTGTLAAGVEAVDGQVVDAVPYAVFVNARDPFIVRALDLVLDQVVDVYDGDLARIIDSVTTT